MNKNNKTNDSEQKTVAKHMSQKALYIIAAVIVVIVVSFILILNHKEPAPPIFKPVKMLRPKSITIKQALSHPVAQSQKKTKKAKAKSGASYLSSINRMSMNLNYLTLQNQVMAQKLALVKAMLILHKSGITSMPSYSNSTGESNTGLFGNQHKASIDIIYKKNNHYIAVININGKEMTIDKRSRVNSVYIVENITKNTVILYDAKNHKTLSLSIAQQMRSI